MNAAILICLYNKNECLPNTLKGLSIQKTTFPWKVIVLNDMSPEDPRPILEKHYPTAEYYELDKRYGGRVTRSKFFDYIDDSVDTLLWLSADVIMLQDNIVQELCSRTEKKKFTLGYVKNHEVLPTVHETFDFFRNQILDMWDILPEGRKVYSGRKRPDGGWYLFMGAIRKDDAITAGMRDTGCCDAIVHEYMKNNGLSPTYCDDLKGIHQYHPYVQHTCLAIGSCEYAEKFRCGDRKIRNE